MPSSIVRAFGKAKKFNPIVRERDNSSDLEKAEVAIHAKFAHIRQGKLDSPNNNGQTISAP